MCMRINIHYYIYIINTKAPWGAARSGAIGHADHALDDRRGWRLL